MGEKSLSPGRLHLPRDPRAPSGTRTLGDSYRLQITANFLVHLRLSGTSSEFKELSWCLKEDFSSFCSNLESNFCRQCRGVSASSPLLPTGYKQQCCLYSVEALWNMLIPRRGNATCACRILAKLLIQCGNAFVHFKWVYNSELHISVYTSLWF